MMAEERGSTESAGRSTAMPRTAQAADGAAGKEVASGRRGQKCRLSLPVEGVLDKRQK